MEPEVLLEDTQENEILKPNVYSDDNKKLKSLNNIMQDVPETNFFVQKSTLSIFRYEDVIFNIYPQLASLKRRGQTTKEIFHNMETNQVASGEPTFGGFNARDDNSMSKDATETASSKLPKFD